VAIQRLASLRKLLGGCPRIGCGRRLGGGLRLRPPSGTEYLHGRGWAGASGIFQQLGTEPQGFNLMLDTLQFGFFLTDYFVDIFHACFRNRVVKI